MDLDTVLGVFSFVLAFLFIINRKLAPISIMFFVFMGLFSYYIYFHESFILAVSGYFTFKFFKAWYKGIMGVWPREEARLERMILSMLPLNFLLMAWVTNITVASYDVLDSVFFVLFYIIMGFAWIYFTLFLFALFFNIHWLHDILELKNKAALVTVCGIYMGAGAIFCGASIGDGPGWWTVILAGFLGLAALLIFAALSEKIAGTFTRITIERDLPCGIRMGFYLLATGILLGRACGGNWYSFTLTVYDFILAFWPAAVLFAVMLLVEVYFGNAQKRMLAMENMQTSAPPTLLPSLIIGSGYFVFALFAVLALLPNMFY